jgi:hypothetical protein
VGGDRQGAGASRGWIPFPIGRPFAQVARNGKTHARVAAALQQALVQLDDGARRPHPAC